MMKRRNERLIELALQEEVANKNTSNGTTPRRRHTIHEIPSPQAFETVTTEPTKTKVSKRSERARSLFFGVHHNHSTTLAEPLIDSLDTRCSPTDLQEKKTEFGDRDDTHVVSTLSGSNKQKCLQYPEPSNCNSNVQNEQKASTSEHSPFSYSPSATGKYSFLSGGVRSRGGVIRKSGVKILKCQRVEIRGNKVELSNIKDYSAVNVEQTSPENLHVADKYENDECRNINKNNADESLQDLHIIREMRNIFDGENKNERREKVPSSNKQLTEEELIRMLEMDDEALDDGSEQENHENRISDDNSSSDESENDNITFGNEALQPTVEEWMSERDPTLFNINFDGYEKKMKVLPLSNEPYHYFLLIATDDFFVMLVEKANNYASKLLSNILDPKSRLRLWKDISVPEMKRFFGVLFHMGTIKLNRVTDYWKTHPLFNLPAFRTLNNKEKYLKN